MLAYSIVMIALWHQINTYLTDPSLIQAKPFFFLSSSFLGNVYSVFGHQQI